MAHERPLVRRAFHDLSLDRLYDALRGGDHFMCASETQRDLWLGVMLGQRLIDPAGYDADASLRSVIDLVPFGLPAEGPARREGVGPRAVVPGVDADSEIVLWNGGLWNWLDPVTAIRAVASVAERRPNVRIVFMGASDRAAAAEASAAAHRVAADLGLLGSVVHFHDRWVAYGERASWLLDADCAISTHGEHMETHFAFRTRLLDCFWAGLPIVCTGGDDLAERVARDDLGATAPPGDVAGVAAGIERVLQRGRADFGGRLAAVAAEFAWPRAAQPLTRWVTEPAATGARLARRGSVGRTPAQRLRTAAYLCGGRLVLDRRYPSE
jgi:glycosyltransferase involved in cell wall biosynthesis